MKPYILPQIKELQTQIAKINGKVYALQQQTTRSVLTQIMSLIDQSDLLVTIEPSTFRWLIKPMRAAGISEAECFNELVAELEQNTDAIDGMTEANADHSLIRNPDSGTVYVVPHTDKSIVINRNEPHGPILVSRPAKAIIRTNSKQELMSE